MLPQIAIIGGTGVGELPFDAPPMPQIVVTAWGETTAQVGALGGVPIVFLPRHGIGHRLPPHHIPFRANIAALRQMGVRAVLGTAAVGGLRADLPPGTLVLLDDFIDYTTARTGKTFFDAPGHVLHTDFSAPYSAILRAYVLDAARASSIALRDGGTYLCADGPRYESPAEVKLFASWGADVVGMTGIPEATLAREASLHYAGIALVTNYGVGVTEEPVSHEGVESVMRAMLPNLLALLVASVARIGGETFPPIGPNVPLPGEVF